MTKQRKSWLALGFVISALFLWLALRGLDMTHVWEYVRAAQWPWLIPALLAYFVTVAARAGRWLFVLRPLAPNLTFSSLFGVVVLGYFGNNVYPLRIGELLRVYVLQRREKVALSAGLATLLVERVFDGTAVLLFVFLTLPLAPLPGGELRLLVAFASLLFLGALGAFLLLALRGEQALRLADWLSIRLLPARWHEGTMGMARRFVVGFALLKRPSALLLLLVTSLVIWLIETGKYWLVMQAFPFHVPFWGLMLLIGLVNLATILPSAPGFIGTFELPAIAVLVLLGVHESMATAYVLVLHATLWLPSALFGLLYMLYAGWRWSDLEQAATIAAASH